MKHPSGFNIADDDDVEFFRSKETRRQKNSYKNCKQRKAESHLRDFSDLANLVLLVGHRCNLIWATHVIKTDSFETVFISPSRCYLVFQNQPGKYRNNM